nr:MAG TPA: glycoside hydrolase family protein [Caudoviricetes sp.]
MHTIMRPPLPKRWKTVGVIRQYNSRSIVVRVR